jgi:spore maturation protein CgeB
MAAVKRIGIFCYEENSLINHVLGLKSGFEQMGIEVATGFNYLNGGRMALFLDMFRPDFVIEINRSRNQITDCDEPFHHISWIQDNSTFRKRVSWGFGGSDMNYFVFDPEVMGFDARVVGRWDYLQMGVDENLYHPLDVEPTWDLTAMGYLPVPLRDEERGIVIQCGRATSTLGEIHDAFLETDIRLSNFHIKRIEDFILAFCRSRDPEFEPGAQFEALMIFFEDRVVRYLERSGYIRDILRHTRNVRLFGAMEWQLDPEFVPHYSGRIYKPSQKNLISNLSRIVFHNGVLHLHERVFEAMASGRPVIMNRTPYDEMPYGIGAHFDLDEHFVFFGPDDVGDVTAALLADDERRRRIGAAARRRCLEGQTWNHRAEKILADFLSR